jgi:glucose-1-phosphate cytidylyltransferase
MRVVILAGGLGTRLSEETSTRPKPMVEIGGRPLLWHIMNLYGHYGLKQFVLALGYKGEAIKDYFLRYRPCNSDITVNLCNGDVTYDRTHRLDWQVCMVDTGDATLTGGRLARLERLLRPEGTFLLTYGDGVADVDIGQLLEFHKGCGKIATVTAVRPPARFGTMQFDGESVREFKEKPQTAEGWINGGFFVFEPEIFDYLDGDETVLEGEPLERLARDGELAAYRHESFWHCMDTLRDKSRLEAMWQSETAPWKVWHD